MTEKNFSRTIRFTRRLAALTAVLTALSAPGSAVWADSAGERAAELAKAGRCEEALMAVESGLEESPSTTATLALRADCLRRLERLDEAWEGYRMLATMRPGEAEVWFWMGTLDRWRGRHQRALLEFERALTLAPDHRDSLEGHARSAMALGRPALAAEDLSRILARHPRDAGAAELLARAEWERGDRAAAERLLEGLFSGSELRLRLGELELAGGRPRAAAGRFRRATMGDAGSVEAWRRLGEAEVRRGRDAEALDAFRRVVEIEPGDLGALYWVGVLATRSGRAAEARAAWDAMLERQPESVGALVGKARLLFHRGEAARALTLANRALDLEPGNGEALTLRASIFSASGRLREAGADFQRALSEDPENLDARIGYGRYTDTHSAGVRGFFDAARVVEGLDDEGAVVNGVAIEPTRIEYLSQGVEAFWRSHVSGRSGLEATLVQRREKVSQLDGGFAIYDFDVLEAAAGLDHHFGAGFRAGWRLGGTRYDPRDAASIEREERLSGRLRLDWSGGRDRIHAALEQRPLIYRGFAGDTQFEIFDELSLGAGWSRRVGFSLRLEASASLSDYGSGESQLFGDAALEWRRGRQLVRLGVRRAPFPKRFLDAENRLQFLDASAAYTRLETPLGGGFRLSAAAEYGRIGAAPRLIEAGERKFDGAEERNSRLLGFGELSWSPLGWRRLTLGARLSGERFDFRSADYNTLDSDAATLFLAVEGGEGRRFRYGFRYGRSQVRDDRDDGYSRDDLELRLEAGLGSFPASGLGSVWLGLEGSLSRNTLAGEVRTYEEERPELRLYLKVPF